ncbi:MAG: hypothetical protein WA188_14325 [Terriglobales bacterium]
MSCCEWDGHAILGGGNEAPAFEGGQHLLVDAVAEPLQDALLDDVAARASMVTSTTTSPCTPAI